MPTARALPLLLSLSVVVACGGRYERNAPDTEEAPSTGGNASAGTSSVAGGTSCGAANCAPDENACQARYETYVEYRTQVIADYADVGCVKSEDCVAFPDQSDCDPTCVRVVTGARRGVSDRLNLFKQTTCSAACLDQPNIACPAPAPARCVGGRCL